MSRYLILGLALLVCAGMVMGAEAPSQAGLPPELVISPQPPLDEQLRVLRDMYTWTETNRPSGGGWMDGLRNMFGGSGSSKPRAVEAAWLFLPAPPAGTRVKAPVARGQLVEVHGLYKPVNDTTGEVVSEVGKIRVSLPQSVETQGLPAEFATALPVAVEGIVESTGDFPEIRASRLKPSDWLTLLRMARVQELQNDLESAQKTYQQATPRTARTSFAAFAKTSAGRVAYNRREVKAARNEFSTAWNTFAGVDRAKRPKHYTWWPTEDGTGWEKLGATKAIAGPLDTLSKTDFWYRFMEFFVTLAQGSRWLGIVFLSVISRVVIWPLTKKQLASAEAMKRLQPQIKALQDKYATDKQKFQEEFWKLCQANGVNPLGGCLPMLIQFPVLILLYKGIREYIVQFDGHSFLWVGNLAAPDYGLLVAYTISMVLFQKMTQKLTPTPTMNPQQAQQQQMMTYMMPAMMFFFFQNFPAAFLLYWLCTNIVYFVQQYAYTTQMNRKAAAGETESITPAPSSGGMTGMMTRMMSLKAKQDEPEKPAEEPKSFHKQQAQSKGKQVSKSPQKSDRKRPRK